MAVAYGNAVRSELLAGVDLLARAVGATLGPRGRMAALPEKANLRGADYSDAPLPNAPVLVTNDGATIARSIVLADPVQNMGAQLAREAAQHANDEAGDGTTTAVVLAHALLHDALCAVEADADPLAIRRGMQRAGEAAVRALEAGAQPVRGEEALARIAELSCRDAKLGALIAQAYARVGLEGVVRIDDAPGFETVLDISEGVTFDRGLLSPHMATDAHTGTAELEHPYILLTDKKLTSRNDLLSTLICAAEDGRDCLVVCDGIEGDALALVLANKKAGDMAVACVLAPEYGEGRRWRMDDLAVQTGGVYVATEAGYDLGSITREMLGSAAHATVTTKRTTIAGSEGDPQAIADRTAQLRYYATHTDYEFNRKRHEERLAKFVSGVATIAVGGATEAEQRERKTRVEDAVGAVRAALEEGVVAGGGAALFDAARGLGALADELSGDERRGVALVRAACAAPARRIADNAGCAGAAICAQLAERPAGTGFDVVRGTFADMAAAGIVDPLRVVRAAFEAALSVAGTALLTEAGVTGGPSAHERLPEGGLS